MTHVLAVIGDPIAHSLSPQMHNAALTACQLPYTYVPFHVAPDQLANAIAGIRALRIRGINVTVPHKETVLPYLDRLDPNAKRIGAVNTIVNDNGILTGYNTDGEGFLRAIHHDFSLDPEGLSVLLIGAGGAARSILDALLHHAIKRITILNRTSQKAEALKATYTPLFPTITIQTGQLSDAVDLPSTTLIINTTSVGLTDTDTTLPLPSLEGLSPHHYVYDVITHDTPFMREAKKRGAATANGRSMLIAQGEAAFTHFTGVTTTLSLPKH